MEAWRGWRLRKIARSVRGSDEKLEPFVYETRGLLASLGRYNGVGNIKRWQIHGFFAMFEALDDGRHAVERAGAALRRALA